MQYCKIPFGRQGLPRESNMELFRIVAMLLVLGIHACWHFIGEPMPSEAMAKPVETFLAFSSVRCVVAVWICL